MNKQLYIIAEFDDKTSLWKDELKNILEEAGFKDRQTPDVPHHITLTCYETEREEEVKELLSLVCSNTKCFDITFSHLGLFGMKVIFLGPDVNYELLDLYSNLDRQSIKGNFLWVAHSTLLMDEPENIIKALPILSEKFKPHKAKVVKLSLYEFFPKRFISEYKLI